ncbi:DNA-processing protein DprA [Candidatus Dependentiae bacterium]|nr:DNA-processing protein DprA [Candidatus Dependentiae bacterium]
MDDLTAALLLNSVKELGCRRFKELVDAFGNPSSVFSADDKQIKKVSQISEILLYKIRKLKINDEIKQIIDKSSSQGFKIIYYGSENYPENLSELYSPPSVLYSTNFFQKKDKMSIAVVGSRFASKYAVLVTDEFVRKLTAAGFTIISGFAKGIDITAHTSAVESGGRTVCVLGTGLDRKCIYPAEHKYYYDKFLKNENVIFLSEYPPETIASKQNFPARNRIVSGLSLGTLITQAGKKSGALITAGMALEQNREVFAVPDRIGLISSIGTNELIKLGHAKLVQDVSDIIEELNIYNNLLNNEQPLKPQYKKNELSDIEEKVLSVLTDTPQKLSEIAETLNMDEKNVNVILMKLEIKNFVCQFPGHLFFKQ